MATSQRRIEALMAAEPSEKIILAGFSQGAAMALHVGLRHQAEVDGVLVMSGYLLESAGHPVPPAEGPWPIGMLHGDEDEVVPVRAAVEAAAALEAAGHAPTFKRYPGLGHSVSEEEIRDVFEWLSGRGS